MKIPWGEERIANETPTTMPDVLTWHWVPVSPNRRLPITTGQIQIRAIAAENHMPSVPIRSLAGCITNTSSCLPVPDADAVHRPRETILLRHRESVPLRKRVDVTH
jgi:hypothetical protein